MMIGEWPACIENVDRLQSRQCKTAKMTASGHAANEGLAGFGSLVHSDSIAQYRSARKRTAGVDRNHADFVAGRAQRFDQGSNECGFAGTRYTGNADDSRLAGVCL